MRTPRSVTARGSVALVVVLGALSAFGPLCLDMYLPALPDLPVSLHSTAAAAQLSLTACIVGLAVGQLIAGPLSDRVGRRVPLLFGVALFTLASAVCALVTSMPALVAMRLLQGAAGAAGIVIGRAVVADLFAGRAAAAYFSSMAAINGLAPILAPVIGGQIVRFGTWRTVFWVLAGVGIALWLLTFAVVRESLPPQRRVRHGIGGVFRSLAVVIRDGPAVGYILAGTLVAAAMFGYISGSPFLLQDGFHLSPQQFSFCFAANAAGIVLAGQTSRILLRRGVQSVRLLAYGVGQAGVGAVVLLVALTAGLALPFVLVGLWVMVSSVGIALPNASALVMDRHRSIAGAASAVFGLAQYATATVTTPLVGIGDRVRGVALGVTAVCCVGLAAATLWFARRGGTAYLSS